MCKRTLHVRMLLTLSCFLQPTLSFGQDEIAGGREGHGGDPLLVEFVAIGHFVYHKLTLSTGSQRLLGDEELQKLHEAVTTTRVELSETPLKDHRGSPVTSLVSPDPTSPDNKLIRIYRPWWKGFLGASVPRSIDVYRYVLHEYLLAAELGDENYQISSRLILTGESEIKTTMIVFCENVTSGIHAISEGENHWQMTKRLRGLYEENRLQWMLDINERFRARLKPTVRVWGSEVEVDDELASYGSMIDDEIDEDFRPYRQFARSESKLYCARFTIDNIPGLEILSGNKISGEAVTFRRFDSAGFEYEQAATDSYNEALSNYQQACDDWLEQLASRLGPKLIFADCKKPEFTITGKADDPDFRKIQFHSSGEFFIDRG